MLVWIFITLCSISEETYLKALEDGIILLQGVRTDGTIGGIQVPKNNVGPMRSKSVGKLRMIDEEIEKARFELSANQATI